MSELQKIKVIGTVLGKNERTFKGKDGIIKSTSRMVIKDSASQQQIEASYQYKEVGYKVFNMLMGVGTQATPTVEFILEESKNQSFTNYKLLTHSMQGVAPAQAYTPQPNVNTQPMNTQPNVNTQAVAPQGNFSNNQAPTSPTNINDLNMNFNK